jgi:NAD(P)-dependent dehydrogenase (short-subunit alcohol dehydrogenase family)
MLGLMLTRANKLLNGPQTMGRVTWTRPGKLACKDIAHAVAYLASREAGYVTGQELHVNGGMYM